MSFPTITPSTIRVKITPNSKKDEYISTLPDGTFKIRIKETPTDGKANMALIDFLKKETHIDWEITSGFTSPRKILQKKS